MLRFNVKEMRGADGGLATVKVVELGVGWRESVKEPSGFGSPRVALVWKRETGAVK
jgi:hypothetical protein